MSTTEQWFLSAEEDPLAAVHNQGLEDFSRVHLAISEPNGTISVIPRQEG